MPPSVPGYTISTDKSIMDPELIRGFLAENSYWAKNIPMENVLRCIENSICFGIFYGSLQVGFARAITDKTTFAYLADVFIIEEHRGHGLSKVLMEVIIEHPELQGLRRWLLATRDAHGLYEKFGFKSLGMPERWMEKHFPYVYESI